MKHIIKVVFLLKSKAPITLQQREYFVETDNYVVANDKAFEQLELELHILSKKFKISRQEFLRYYKSAAMSEINIIKGDL